MTTAVELEAQRRQTAAFIDVNPITVALIPSTPTKTAAGGWSYVDAAARAPQTFRLVPSISGLTTADGRPIQTQDGQDSRIDYVMIAPYDAVVQVGDYWVDANGNKFRVQFLLQDNNYEIRAGVTVHAGS